MGVADPAEQLQEGVAVAACAVTEVGALAERAGVPGKV
ncbi:hypothetical protein chiPu_0033094, partial [Chiloscyllium punctatum]|nr:hypothetical protein [Chiloscyllium punctatum]